MLPTVCDSPTFCDKGTEVPSLSWDKGTTGQAQNLAKRRDGMGQPVKIRNGTWGKILAVCPILSHWKKRDRAEKDILKQEK